MTSGIYAILNIENDKFYIGQAIDLKKRWQSHQNLLAIKKQENRELYLQTQRRYNQEFKSKRYKPVSFIMVHESVKVD